MSSQSAEDLLRDGIQAARADDKERARELLQQVIDIDQYNEKAWFWLASVVETDEERRTCLGNVVLINPNNARAQELLERLERGISGGVSSGGAADSSRRTLLLAIGGAMLLGIVALVALNSLGGDDGTPAADVAGATATLTPTIDETLANAPPTETFTPSPTRTPAVATLPPAVSLTPTPTTEVRTENVVEMPPGMLSGQVIMSSGRNFASRAHIPLFIMPLNNPSADVLQAIGSSDILGSNVSLNPTNNQIVFEQYNTGQQTTTLQIGPLNGSDLQLLTQFWGRVPAIPVQLMPDWSPVGDEIVFVGEISFARERNLQIVNLAAGPVDMSVTPIPGSLTALTTLSSDTVDESWPQWSPDGLRIVYVADTSLTGINGIDLRIYDRASDTISQLTNDGISVAESMPNWGGPGGGFVVYSGSNSSGSDIWIAPVSAAQLLQESLPTATPPGISPTPAEDDAVVEPTATETPAQDETTDDGVEAEPTLTPEPTIAPTDVPIEETIDLGGITEPQRLIDFGPNDISPIWSPDNQYILFASDLRGDFDIYVYEFATGEIFLVYGEENTREVAFEWIN